MPIDRSGPVPPYWQYIVETVLVPQSGLPNQNLIHLTTANLRWVIIPTYQRGVSWDEDDVNAFLSSESVLLGSVILGQFPTPNPKSGPLTNLPPDEAYYHVLVDGLQRLAVGTVLLALLHDDYLAPTPNKLNNAPLFAGLTALVQSRAPAYLHNDYEFRNHPRKAIRDQYGALRLTLSDWISEKEVAGKIADVATLVTRTMTAKQVAVDVYFNFPGNLQLMNTFLGLNTVRVDLGPVDLVRSYLVEKATSDGWSASDVEMLENDFTGVFVKDGKPDPELLPFVNVVRDLVPSQATAASIFPSWATTLDNSEVDDFLQFVTDFKLPGGYNPYFSEIRSCGKLPYTVLIVFYYQRYLAGGVKPSFLTGGIDETADLHAYLRATYRVLLDGRIGRISNYVQNALSGNYPSLTDLANKMSVEYLGYDLSHTVDSGWLWGVLSKVNQNRAKRIFNAMLLPEFRSAMGGEFEPLLFGQKAVEFNIDHLIADSMLIENQSGASEGQTIRNFAPLPTNQNRVAKATSCSAKLGLGGIYDTYVAGGLEVHPYQQWLVNSALALKGADLDNQALLEANKAPDIGDERLREIKGILEQRL